jgi:hypothetical protein
MKIMKNKVITITIIIIMEVAVMIMITIMKKRMKMTNMIMTMATVTVTFIKIKIIQLCKKGTNKTRTTLMARPTLTSKERAKLRPLIRDKLLATNVTKKFQNHYSCTLQSWQVLLS